MPWSEVWISSQILWDTVARISIVGQIFRQYIYKPIEKKRVVCRVPYEQGVPSNSISFLVIFIKLRKKYRGYRGSCS